VTAIDSGGMEGASNPHSCAAANFAMYCCSGVRHSGRTAQWVPSCTSDQYEMLSPAPSAL